MISNNSNYNVFNLDNTINPQESFDIDPLEKYSTEENFQSIWGDGLITAFDYYDEDDAYFSDEIEGKAREEYLLELELKKFGNDPPLSDLFGESDFEWDYDMEYEK